MAYLETAIAGLGEELGPRAQQGFMGSICVFAADHGQVRVFPVFVEAGRRHVSLMFRLLHGLRSGDMRAQSIGQLTPWLVFLHR